MRLPQPDPPPSDGVVLLRPWEEGDLPLLEQASTDEYVALIEGLPLPFGDAAGRAWIARHQAHAGSGRGWSFAIAEAASDRAVGGAGVVLRHVPGVAEPGVWVVADRRNEGIGRRAARLLCRWALCGAAGIERLQATAEPWNRASQRVLEELGSSARGCCATTLPGGASAPTP